MKDIKEGTPDFPVFAKPEGEGSKPKSESKSDPRHREITSRIGTLHRDITGQPVIVTGRDVTALKKFLTSWSGTADEFLATAADAWTRGREDSFARNCLEGSSLAGLCNRWPQIRGELARPLPAPPRRQQTETKIKF